MIYSIIYRILPNFGIRRNILYGFCISMMLLSLFGYPHEVWARGGRESAETSEREENPHAEALESIAVQPLFIQLPIDQIGFARFDGTTATLANWRGSVVLLNFWATWCLPCREELPDFQILQQTLGSLQFTVLALNAHEPEETARLFWDELGIRLPVGIDVRGEIGDRLGVRGLPTTFIIDPLGRIIGRKVGIIDWDAPEVVAVLNDIIAAAPSGTN